MNTVLCICHWDLWGLQCLLLVAWQSQATNKWTTVSSEPLSKRLLFNSLVSLILGWQRSCPVSPFFVILYVVLISPCNDVSYDITVSVFFFCKNTLTFVVILFRKNTFWLFINFYLLIFYFCSCIFRCSFLLFLFCASVLLNALFFYRCRKIVLALSGNHRRDTVRGRFYICDIYVIQ